MICRSFFVLSIVFHSIIYRMNSKAASKITNVYRHSDSDDSIGLPVFDGKKDDITNDRLEKALFDMVDADIAASSQGATEVAKMPLPTKHDATADATMTTSSTATAWKFKKGVG